MVGPEPHFASHGHSARATVRARPMRRQSVLVLEAQGAFAIVEPQTPPRLWHVTSQAVLHGFERGAGPRAGGASHRLVSAVEAAREGLLGLSRRLLVRDPPDAYLTAFILEGEELVGSVIGEGRVYVRRPRQRTERLSPRELPSQGLWTAAFTPFKATVGPGSIVFGGTETAFNEAAIQRSAQMLDRHPDVHPSTLATALTEPAEQAGTGAAVVVVRV